MTAEQNRYELLAETGHPWYQQAEDFAKLIAPTDLAARPFYVIVPEAGGRFDFRDSGCRGWTVSFADLICRDLLKSQDRWRGRGYAVVVRDRWDRDDFFSTSMHELCHALLDPPTAEQWKLGTEDHPPGSVERSIGDELARMNYVPGAVGQSSQLPPWHAHGESFIRMTIHLLRRAERFGLRLDRSRVFAAGPHYQLSALAAYERCLGAEPESWGMNALTAIADRPAPAAFSNLFLQDTASWRWRHDPTASESEMRAAFPESDIAGAGDDRSTEAGK